MDTSEGARIAIVVCLYNAGMTTRGLKIAKAIAKENAAANIQFFSWDYPQDSDSSTYESIIDNAGFQVTTYSNPLSRSEWNEILEIEQSGTGFRDTEFFENRITECTKALGEYKPDIIVHGMVPDAAVASQLLGIPNIQYGPIPCDRDYMLGRLITDLPDSNKGPVTRYLPRFVTKFLFHWVHPRSRRLSAVTQAALRCGWKPKTPTDLNVFSTATCYLVMDLPLNYELSDLPAYTKVIGPMFADIDSAGELSSDVEKFMEFADQENGKIKVFVTMGSSGDRESIAEAVKAVSFGDCYAVVAVPPCRCAMQEIEETIAIPSTVILTDNFVPAQKLAAWADVVLCHGGQGTCQQALAASTPMVGVGLQFEQEWNLENIVRMKAAIRLPKWQWKCDKIRTAMQEVARDGSYKKAAEDAAETMATFDAEEEAATIVLQNIAEGRGRNQKL